jgi:hypothetical protein
MKRLTVFAAICLLLATWGCKNYGTKLEYGKGELFYTAAVTETEAKKLGEYLEKGGYYKGDQRKSVQLDKQGDTYAVKFVVKEGLDKDEKLMGVFKTIANDISQTVFSGAKVDAHVCDDGLNTLKVVSAGD